MVCLTLPSLPMRGLQSKEFPALVSHSQPHLGAVCVEGKQVSAQASGTRACCLGGAVLQAPCTRLPHTYHGVSSGRCRKFVRALFQRAAKLGGTRWGPAPLPSHTQKARLLDTASRPEDSGKGAGHSARLLSNVTGHYPRTNRGDFSSALGILPRKLRCLELVRPELSPSCNQAGIAAHRK